MSCRLRRWTVRILTVFGLLVILYLLRAPILTGFANVWVVNDTPSNADAIVVLGGGFETRPQAAAQLYKQGLAPRILYMDVKLTVSDEMGFSIPERELTHRLLLTNGVPENALEALGHGVSSTYDESCVVRAWIQAHHAKSIIITTDAFHTRRVRWLFKKQLKGVNAQTCVVAVKPKTYDTTDWWHHEEGLISFQNEWIKLPFYWLKY